MSAKFPRTDGAVPGQSAQLADGVSGLFFRVGAPLFLGVLLASLGSSLGLRVADTTLLLAVLAVGVLDWQLRGAARFRLRLVLALLTVLALFGLSLLGPPPDTGVILLSIILMTPLSALLWTTYFSRYPAYRALLVGGLISGAGMVLFHFMRASFLQADPELTSVHPLVLAAALVFVSLLATVFGLGVAQGERAARQDALTGLLNRRAFNEEQRHWEGGGWLAVLDIDHFKRINDRYGHEAGDRVLRSVADVLMDTVPLGSAVYRWGGEEFVVRLPPMPLAEAQIILQEARGEVAQRTFAAGEHITLSAGLSPLGGEPARAFADADSALLIAKSIGRDRVMVAD